MFVGCVNYMAANNKVPAWMKPFLESIKIFAKDVSNAINELEGRLGVQKAVTDGLAKDREILQEKITSVEIALQDQLQYSRRNMVLIHGIDEINGQENTDEIALQVFQKMNVPMEKHHINRSHRLGQRNKLGDNKKRPIIVSFTSYRQKKLVYDGKKMLKGSKTVITESLTKCRYALLQQCWDTYGKQSTWTYDGRIYVSQDGNKFCVTSAEDLAERRH